jgi:CBS domain-containing protein
MSPVRPKTVVRDLMTYPVMCALSTDRLLDLYALMSDRRIRHLPVLSQGRLVGIISDRDILTYGQKQSGCLVFPPNLRASDIMSADVVSCTPDTPLAEAAARMVDIKVDALPVVDENNHLVGVVTASDIMGMVGGSSSSEDGLSASTEQEAPLARP